MNSAGNNLLVDALLQAKEPGETAAPAKLISLAAGLAQPLQALQDLHDAHGLFAAFDGDFGFIRLSFRHQPKGPNAPTPLDNRARYGSLLRWLIEELRNWRRADDPDFRKLVAIMIAARVCDFGNELWNLLPDDIAENLDLSPILKVSSRHSTLLSMQSGGERRPLGRRARRGVSTGGRGGQLGRGRRYMAPNPAHVCECASSSNGAHPLSV